MISTQLILGAFFIPSVMTIFQQPKVEVYLKPPSMVAADSKLSAPSPIQQIYGEKSENFQKLDDGGKLDSPSPIHQKYCEAIEKFPSKPGKTAVWVEKEDFYGGDSLSMEVNGDAGGMNATNHPKRRNRRKSQAMDEIPYLLVGFDTEFKTPEHPSSKLDIEGGRAKYQVLSYQFHARTSDGREWTGICCPEGNERLSLNEFLIFVLGCGSREHGFQDLPTMIFMVGHFTRADLPAFAGRSEFAEVFSNVRNTFVTIGAPMPVMVQFETGEVIELSVHLRDTMLLTPATSKKLSALGDLLGVPKKVLATPQHDHQWMIQHMDFCRDNYWEMFRDYAITDATIAMLYGERVIGLYKTVEGRTKFPLTLSSIGVDLLLKELSLPGMPSMEELFGVELHKRKIYDKQYNTYRTTKEYVPIESVHRYEAEATECYHGGRNEQFWFGPCFEDEWTDFDLQNAYPTAMALIGLPHWTEMYVSKNIDDFQPTTLGYADVEFEFPDSVRYPVLPVRTDHGIVFPRTGRSRCGAPEIFVAKTLGAKLNLHFGLIVPTDPGVKPFADFTKKCVDLRKKAGKKTLEGLFWKEITNSTYGKTAQGLRTRRVYDLRSNGTQALQKSKITNPYFAAFITSAVRAVLGELMNGLPTHKMIFSCTTDGFLTNASETELLALSGGRLYQEFSTARQVMTGDPSVLEVKHRIRRPLGWRTRGQATLIAGQVVPESDAHIVLAKGGIYLPRYMETVEQQNDSIVEMFLARTPESKVQVVSSVGIREIMNYDADFVEKTFVKRLGMEYDWKRCPAMVDVDKATNHVFFHTKAWDSVTQFIAVRDGWDEYVKGNPVCIKTLDDFNNWKTFIQIRSLAKNMGRVYMSRVDGDLKLLRQALCSAWKHQSAGMSALSRDYSAQEFADLLTLCGIPCKKTDVENGKKKEYNPHRVPPTDRVLNAIDQLVLFMPQIERGDLLFRSSADFEVKFG